MCAKTTVAPLDRMKILLQAHNKHYKNMGVFSGIWNVVKRERFPALYNGNGAQMVRVFPYAAIQFTTYELYREVAATLAGPTSNLGSFLSGSMAGVTAVLCTYPLDMIRARLAFQVAGERRYSGILHVAVSIVREEGGARALYRGFSPTVVGMIPYAGLSFFIFDQMKQICMRYLPEHTCHQRESNTGGLGLNTPARLACGALAGAAAQSVSYPFDVTRRRMQLAYLSPETRKFGIGMWETLRLIWKENGVARGLYRGMSINYMRAIPMVSVSFFTYETMKDLLRLDTGLKIKIG